MLFFKKGKERELNIELKQGTPLTEKRCDNMESSIKS
jgi:hypothetical protein